MPINIIFNLYFRNLTLKYLRSEYLWILEQNWYV